MSTRYPSPSGLLIALPALLAAFPGCHEVFPYPGATPPTVDAAVPRFERILAKDTSPEAGIIPPDDASPDLPIPPKLICDEPERVSKHAQAVFDPALRVNRLELVATTSGGLVTTRREAINLPFGTWQPCTTGVLADYTDLSFFKNNSEAEVALAATRNRELPRRLWFCSPITATSCQSLSLVDQGGVAISSDMDGPSVIRPHSELLMVFNREPTLLQPDIYLGRPSTADLLTWKMEPISALSNPNYGEDDPTISPEGLIIVFTHRTSNINGTSNINDLWISHRPSINQPFGPPTELANVNSSSSEGGALLSGLPDDPDHLELFFYSSRDGDSQIYRSLCSR